MTAWLLLTVSLLSQQIARDTPIPSTDRGAAVRGIVVSDDPSRKPVRHALVTLSARGLFTADVVTADDGAFAFQAVPAGTYRLTVSKPGYPASEFGVRPGRDVGTPIAIAAAQQLESLELRLFRGGVVTGRLTGPSGEPIARASVSASTIRLPPVGPRATPTEMGQALSDDEGMYRIYGLPEGDYTISATLLQPKDKASAYQTTSYPGVADAASAASVSISANDEHAGIDFAMQPAVTGMTGTEPDGDARHGTTISGRAIIDSASSRVPTNFTVFVLNTLPFPLGHGGNGAPRADGTWVINDVLPGVYSIGGSADANDETQSTWLMQSATLDGHDVMNAPFAVSTAAIDGLVVTLTDKVGSVGGRLTTAANAPATDYLVVVFPADRALWSRKPAVTRVIAPDTNGAWRAPPMLPGEYRVAVVTDWTSRSRVTPELLEQLLPSSASAIITVGTTTAIDLKVGK